MPARSKQDTDTLWMLVKKVGELEKTVRLTSAPSALQTQVEKLELLTVQLTKHINPTREEVALLKKSLREAGKEIMKLHELLAQYHGEQK